MSERFPDKARAFKFTEAWFYGFLEMYNLRPRNPTCKKAMTLPTAIITVRRYFKWMSDMLRDEDGETKRALTDLDPIWGRFLPIARINKDELPGNFGKESKTLDVIGKKAVR